jgi:hypothetical protein
MYQSQQIHVLVDALGNPVMLTPGQAHDLACAEPLPKSVYPDALLGDKAYDADSLIGTLAQRCIAAVIPPKAIVRSRGPAISRSTGNGTSSSASSINSSILFSSHRDTLRQARQNIPGRSSARFCYHPAQLKTGSSNLPLLTKENTIVLRLEACRAPASRSPQRQNR